MLCMQNIHFAAVLLPVMAGVKRSEVMDMSLISQLSEDLDLESPVVSSVLDEFFLQLHKRFYEYRGVNGDYIGEELNWEISNQAFYHLLGCLETFAGRYDWKPGSANELLLRLGDQATWLPYRHQTLGWKNARDDV